MLTPSAAAKALGVSTTRIRALAADGRLPCLHTPYGRLFDPTQIEIYRARRDAWRRGIKQAKIEVELRRAAREAVARASMSECGNG